MSPPLFFDLSYEIITPLFMAGSDPARPELRAASIRGAVRAWYRALDPDFLRYEGSTFGAAFDGDDGRSQTRQSPFLLQVLQPPPDAGFELRKEDYESMNRGRPPKRTNGVLYTGYTLRDRFNQRRAFHPSEGRTRRSFILRLLFPRPGLDPEGMRQMHLVLGSFWALGHLGALGSRANRCWGSAQLTKLKAGPGKQVPSEVADLVRRYQPASTTSPQRWRSEVAGVLDDIAEVLDYPKRSGVALATPHLGAGACLRVSRRAASTWAEAVDHIGAELQSFRRERGQLDRRITLQELLRHQPRGPAGKELPHALQRTAFGLPYTMRYGLTPGWVKGKGLQHLEPDTIEFNPGDRGKRDSPPRHASPLRLRIIRLDSGYHPVMVRMAGDPVGTNPRSGEVEIGGQILAGKSNRGRIDPKARPHPTDELLDAFMEHIAADTLSIPVPQ